MSLHSDGHVPACVFLLGREVGLDKGMLTIRDPALRRLAVDHLPSGVELGAVLVLPEPHAADEVSSSVKLEVLRPSGSAALSVNDTLDQEPVDSGAVWARTLRVVIDEVGLWTVSIRACSITATVTIAVGLEVPE
ncbi:hypothetical protein NE857_12895 [Nocardiopsis exhalans]|uniref:Uncharacterized protein n=1 Tax=Nocardiopsis exhalans TaxID=163604 RepID=A0ABY5DH36_9ACTN|nr:hypothetical protein [Nocardiopsis exhalans]USY22421.1 hypothetical protein NE857_12895 [Nocardiopsis exhalans]